MEQITLTAKKRETVSKGNLKTSRKQGLIPSVVYGSGEKTIPLFINEKELIKILRTDSATNVIIKLQYDSMVKNVLMKEIQKDVLSLKPLHVDFQIVSMEKKIEVNIPIKITGEAPGVKAQGGILEHITREIRVKCLPAKIPGTINVDVSSLNIGNNVTLKELKIPADVEVLGDPNSIILHIIAPTKVEEVAPTVDAISVGPAEPEIISKGKKEEEEEETAETGKPQAKQPAAPEQQKEKKPTEKK